MTDLENSPVTRRTTTTYKGRRIVVTLHKDDRIELRLERLSTGVKIPIHDLWLYAERREAYDLIKGKRK